MPSGRMKERPLTPSSVVNAQIEETKVELEKAERSGTLSTAAELKHGRLPELQRKLAAAEQALGEVDSRRAAAVIPGSGRGTTLHAW